MKENPIAVGIVGAGRIGAIHAANVAENPRAELILTADAKPERAGELSARHGGAATTKPEDVLDDPRVDAILICSPTATHADYLEHAVRRNKAVFCEKPIDLDLGRAEACWQQLGDSELPIQLGFNRRFDPSHAAVRKAVSERIAGTLQQVLISSRDPAPPPKDYVKGSGGIFQDMMIHDFDMARFICGEDIVSVSATGQCLVSDDIRVCGDFDTATATLTMQSGTLVTISNARNCAFGYDQRIEVFGSEGMVTSENIHATSHTITTANAYKAGSKLLSFFTDRYAESYKLELDHFIECVRTRNPPSIGLKSGLEALRAAEAAAQSAASGETIVL